MIKISDMSGSVTVTGQQDWIVEMFAQVEQHHIVKTGIAPVAVRAQ